MTETPSEPGRSEPGRSEPAESARPGKRSWRSPTLAAHGRLEIRNFLQIGSPPGPPNSRPDTPTPRD